MKKLKVGLVGCGGVSQVHLDAYSKMENVEVVCVTDIEERRAIKAKEKYGIKLHLTDYNELVKRDDIDIIDVCLPTYLHVDIVVKGAKAGKHIFCEKPIAMKLKDADEMIAACKESNVKFMVGLCRRFDNEWLKFKELVEKNIIGRPIIWRHISAFGDVGDPWYFDREKSGGPFVDGGIHSFDFAKLLFGEVSTVFSDVRAFRKRTTAPDTGTVIIRFKSGDELVLEWTWGLPPGCEGTDLQDAIGPKGIIIFPPASDPLHVDLTKPGTFTINEGGGKSRTEEFKRNNMYLTEIEHFINCVNQDVTPKVTGEEAKKALSIGLTVLEAAEKGETIKVLA